MIQKHLKLACAYARCSTDDQAGSIPAQWEALAQFAEREGFEIVERFSDDGASGTTNNRLGLRGMMARAKSGQAPWRHILVWDRSRFMRPEDAREGIATTLELERDAGCIIVPMNGAQRTGDATADAVIELLEFGQAGQESVRKSRDIQRGQRAAAERGSIPNGRVPYAYDALYIPPTPGRKPRRIRYEPDGSKLILSPDGKHVVETWPRSTPVRKVPGDALTLTPGDPDRVATVQRIFSDYNAGKSCRTIAHNLNADGVPSPKGGEWRKNTIGRVLGNLAYKGTLAWNRASCAKFHRSGTDGKIERVSNPRKQWHDNAEDAWVLIPDKWKPIVSEAVWDKAAKRLASTAPSAFKGRGHASPYLASTLLRCQCGAPMIGSSGYYRCSDRTEKGTTLCAAPSIKREFVDDYLSRRIDELSLQPKAHALIMADVQEALEALLEAEQSRPGTDPAERLRTVEGHLERLVSKVASGLLEDGEARPLLAKLRAERSELQAASAKAPEALARSVPAVLKRCREILRETSGVWTKAAPPVRKRIVRAFVRTLNADQSRRAIDATFVPGFALCGPVIQSGSS